MDVHFLAQVENLITLKAEPRVNMYLALDQALPIAIALAFLTLPLRMAILMDALHSFTSRHHRHGLGGRARSWGCTETQVHRSPIIWETF